MDIRKALGELLASACDVGSDIENEIVAEFERLQLEKKVLLSVASVFTKDGQSPEEFLIVMVSDIAFSALLDRYLELYIKNNVIKEELDFLKIRIASSAYVADNGDEVVCLSYLCGDDRECPNATTCIECWRKENAECASQSQ